MLKTDSEVTPARFSSQHTRDLIQQAQTSLGEVLDAQRLDEQFARLAAEVDEKDPAKLKQLQALAKLLHGRQEQGGLEGLKRQGRFELRLSEDAMALMLDVAPPVAGGEPVTAEQVLAELAARGIERGVDRSAIDAAVAQAAADETVGGQVVVRGQPARPGQDERLERFGRPAMDEPLQRIDDASDGLAGQSWLCAEGDRIMSHVPAVPGTPGFDARGGVLQPPELARVTVEVGQNVREENGDYFAQIGGVIGFDGRRVEVRQMLVLNEDVTGKSRPVEFEGHLTIRGAVRNGARVQATGDIVVFGPVEAAHIESTQGSIDLRHGVAGQHRGVIRAAQDITARFAENVTLFAGQDVMIKLGALHSHVAAGRALRVTGGRGQFIGGSAAAGELIQVKQLGSSSGVPTEALIGLTRELMLQLGKLDETAAGVRRQRDQARELADRIERAIGDPERLTPEEFKSYTALRKCEFVTDHRLEQIGLEREELLGQAAERHDGHVDVLGELMPRVTVRIGRARLDNEENRRRCRLAYDPQAEQVVVQSLR